MSVITSQHEAQVRDKNRLDLRSDPPPDLVVEIDITHRDVDRLSIYAAMGVPEIWLFDGQQLRAMGLTPPGAYEQIERSRAFPALRVAELHRFMTMLPGTDLTTMLRAFRAWVRQGLLG